MNKQKKFIEEASIRLALIQPAYNETYLDASKRAYYYRITEKPIKMPDTERQSLPLLSISSIGSESSS